MSFVNNFFKRGRINIFLGNPGVGKTHAVVYLTHKATKHNFKVLNNICMFKKENIEEAKRLGWLKKDKIYLEVPENYQYIPLASELIIKASQGQNNIVVIDEAGITASSSKALSNTSVQMKFLGFSIRKIGACLIIIAQDETSVVPTLRSALVSYKVNVIEQDNGRRDLQFLKAEKRFNAEKNINEVKFVKHDYRRGVPMVELPYDTVHPGGFIFDINLEQLYQTIAKTGYDSVELKKHIVGIVQDMVADYKMDEFMRHKKFMKTGTVALLLDKGTTTIKKWADEGKLKCIKDSMGFRLFSRMDVKKFAKENNIPFKVDQY